MSEEYLPSANILELPPEIIERIVSKLPYTDIESVRLTCPAFNDAGMYIQKTALRKMRSKADSALRKCHTGFQQIIETRARRAVMGTASVKCLSGILRVADASTFPFLLDGSLPPVPAALLVEIEKALNIATRKNPLVGRSRLKRIFSSFNKYLTTTMNSLKSPLTSLSVFRSCMDLLFSLPFKTYNITQTDCLLECFIYINPLTVRVSSSGETLTGPILIQFLAKLNVKGIREFINVNMGKLFTDELQTVDTTIEDIVLLILSNKEQTVGVNTLQQVCRLEPTYFTVTLCGVNYVRPHDQGNVDYIRTSVRNRPLLEGEELAFYTYRSFT